MPVHCGNFPGDKKAKKKVWRALLLKLQTARGPRTKPGNYSIEKYSCLMLETLTALMNA